MGVQVVVGLDFGSSSVKASAFRPDGSLVGTSRVVTPTVRTSDGVDIPVAAALEAADEAVSGLGLGPAAVAAVGVATMGEVGTVLTDGGLADLHFPAWYDMRGQEVVRVIARTLGEQRVAGLTGNHLRATSSLAKLSWLAGRSRLPAGTFLGIGAAWVWRMTRSVVAEAGLLSTTGAYDPIARRPVADVWELGGLERQGVVVPWAARPGARAVTGVAERIGLQPGAPVVLAGHDHLVGAVGVGLADGEVLDSVGTSEGLIAWTTPPGEGRVAWAEHAVALGLTIEPRPGAGADEVALIWEGLRPGLAMAAFERASGRPRSELEGVPVVGAAATSREDAVLWEEGHGPGRADDRAWAALVTYYAQAAADGVRTVRDVARVEGAVVLTGVAPGRRPGWVQRCVPSASPS
ncbi:FGGY family carbohydrate kinase [Luteimicrobium album]|nr:FGGY family carbohydrate kinase [Luteimicrobium album]